MKIKDYQRSELQHLIKKGVFIGIHPFIVKIQSQIPEIIKSISVLYADYDLLPDNTGFADFHITVNSPLLRWGYKPQARFYVDGKQPFLPLPISQAYPFLEWGLNWCIAQHSYTYLLIHAAVVEKNSQVLILPGDPGAGKSTLCAALINSGWRLLSDEMAMIDLKNIDFLPIVRPVALKNESIDIIKNFAPHAIFGDSFYDTSKGTVAHLKPDNASVDMSIKKGKGKWVVFPKYLAKSKMHLSPVLSAQTVLRLAENSFNYNILGNKGFEVLCALVKQCDCYEFTYSHLNDAIEQFTALAEIDY